MSSGKKVFVGNLNYETSEDDLKSTFSKAGKVVEAKIVRRGYRSKGYGFVEFEEDEHAQKAVELFDKFSLNDRTINVQVSTSSGVKVGNTNGNYDNNRNYDNYRNYDNRNYDNRNYDNRNYENRNYENYDNRNYDNYDNYRPRRRPPQGGYRNSYYQRPRGRVYFLRNNYNENRNDNRNRQRRYNNKSQFQTQKENVEKIESKTTIFVANLPFSVDDEGLVTLFSKCGQIRTAHVVRNRGRSKGFGFVEFESQEGQTNALKTMDNFPVPYRNGEQKNLSVKVAQTEIKKQETTTTTTTED